MSEDVTSAPDEGAPRPQPKATKPRPRAARPRREPSAATKKNAPAGLDVGPGAKIAGYQLEEQIGQGGMAVVYRARDERLDRQVALKLLAPGIAADTAFRQRFIRESRAAAAVDHPNIIPVYDAGDSGHALFIAMRYVQGGDVRSLLAENGPLPPARTWGIISQVAAALDAAHARGLIHRDVKPANMLLDLAARATGDQRPDHDLPEHVYLSDFGISKQSLSSQLTSTGQFVGTLDYIAPEQIEGQSVDGRTDQYSLGCAAFELLSATPPFQREQAVGLIAAHLSESPPSLTARRPDLPAAVDLVLAKAMAKSPAERYPTCAQFAADLGRVLGLVPGEVQAATPAVVPESGAGTGDKPKPWPATELAGRGSGPDARPGTGDAASGAAASRAAASGAAASGAAATPAGGQPGAGPGTPAAPEPIGAPQGVDPATMLAAQPGMPSGTTPPGAAGQAGPYAQGPSGQQPLGPGQGVQYGQPSAPGQHGPTQYGQPSGPGQQGPGQYAQPSGPGQYGPGQYGQPGPAQYGPGQYGPQPGPGQYGPVQYGPGQYGPGQYTQPQPTNPPKRSRGVLVGVTIAAVAIVAAGAVVVIHLKGSSGSTSPSPPPTSASASSSPSPTPASSSQGTSAALSEATAISNLLSSGAGNLTKLNTAIANAQNCTNLSSAVSQIQQVASARQVELSQAEGLSTGALPNGATLKSDLIRALRYSLNADNDYLNWANQQNANCQFGSQANASTANNGASTYKSLFISLWSPIASQYGLQQVTTTTM